VNEYDVAVIFKKHIPYSDIEINIGREIITYEVGYRDRVAQISVTVKALNTLTEEDITQHAEEVGLKLTEEDER